MRVGLGKNWGVLAASREAIPVAKQSVGAEGGEELFADYFNQAIFQITQDYVLGTASDVGFGEANIYYNGGGNFLDEDNNPVVFAKGDRIRILTIDNLTSELLFTTDGLEFLQHPQETIDLTAHNFRVTGVGCRGDLNFINCRESSIILEGSENFLGISTNGFSGAVFKNGQDIIENGRISEIDAGQNLLYNASASINTRGNKPACVNSDYSLDGFIYTKVGSMVSTFQQGTDGPTVAQSGVKVVNCIDVTTTTAQPVLAQFDRCMVSQCIEGYNILSISEGFATLGFWVSSPVAGVHCCSFRNGGTGAATFADKSVPDASLVKEYTINAPNVWEFKVMTIPIDDTFGTWHYDNGLGLTVSWVLASGDGFHTPNGVWISGFGFGTSNQVNTVSVLGSFKVAIPKLLAGQDYQRFKHALDDTRHLRHYENVIFSTEWYSSVAGENSSQTLGIADKRIATGVIAQTAGAYTNVASVAAPQISENKLLVKSTAVIAGVSKADGEIIRIDTSFYI